MIAAPTRAVVISRASVRVQAKARALAVRATPKEDLDRKIADAINQAQEVCSTDDKNGCASAWDTVEELSAKKAHEKAKEVPNDPLEKYCATEPDADECRVHDN